MAGGSKKKGDESERSGSESDEDSSQGQAPPRRVFVRRRTGKGSGRVATEQTLRRHQSHFATPTQYASSLTKSQLLPQASYGYSTSMQAPKKRFAQSHLASQSMPYGAVGLSSYPPPNMLSSAAKEEKAQAEPFPQESAQTRKQMAVPRDVHAANRIRTPVQQQQQQQQQQQRLPLHRHGGIGTTALAREQVCAHACFAICAHVFVFWLCFACACVIQRLT